MNPKIKKLKAEHQKNDEKIELLRSRNKELDQQIQDLENLDIVDLVRDQGMTPEQLRTVLERMAETGGGVHA